MIFYSKLIVLESLKEFENFERVLQVFEFLKNRKFGQFLNIRRIFRTGVVKTKNLIEKNSGPAPAHVGLTKKHKVVNI